MRYLPHGARRLFYAAMCTLHLLLLVCVRGHDAYPVVSYLPSTIRPAVRGLYSPGRLIARIWTDLD